MTQNQLQEIYDYVWRTEQSGVTDPAIDRCYLLMLAGEAQKLSDRVGNMQAALDDILDIAVSV